MKKKIIIGTAERPRLYIFKSNKHLYAQLIDDVNNKIITTSSTISPEIKQKRSLYRNCKTARIIGEQIAIKSKAKGLETIIFDRGKNLYHGQIKALAEAIRKQGIHF
uniref:Large ribosomal subunit protein uL18c n=1 Tax=Centroceras clavulatum TaxID=159503 RepID=A0A4D6WNS8_9FLOR|nr:ribosomal protein L18 [Centroceras clavulatum]